MKKSIIIVSQSLSTGGAERALVEMVKKLSPELYNVTILLMDHNGTLHSEVPEWCNIIMLNEIEQPIKYIFELIKNAKIISAIKKILCLLKIKNKDVLEKHRILARFLPKIKQRFDIAISYFSLYHVIPIYVIDNITACKKILWVHADVRGAREEVPKFYGEYFSKYDKIVSVSRIAMEHFDEEYPLLKDKTCVINNILDIEKIKSMAKTSDIYLNEGLKICTVGRLEEVKGYYIAIDACEIMTKLGYNFTWYVCGDGTIKENLHKKIKEKGLEKQFVLLGTQLNPYKYIENCDIYCQTSLREGYCITIAEARVLNKPIVSTNFECVVEQITPGVDGIVVEKDPISVANALMHLIDNPDERIRLSKNTSFIENDSVNDLNLLFS